MDKTDIFIQKAKEVHKGENIDYSCVVYKNNRTPVKLIDHDLKDDGTEYGEFWQTPYNHLSGQCHPLKKGKRISKTKSLSQEEIIERFKKVHKGENLDYSEVIYVNMHTPVKIISHDLRPDGTEYGEFWQEPVVHLKGCTHPEIGKRKLALKQTLTTEEFIEKAKKIHINADFDYSQVNYVNNRTKVKILCNKCDSNGKKHGIFETSPDNFLQGKGCPKCGNHISKAEDEIIEFIEKLLNIKVEKRNHNILNGKELDIYIPDLKIAFEYNGLRWHSEQFNKDRNYHLIKKNECDKKGIKLFHIFEDEFIYNKDALFAKIKRILNCDFDLPKIPARKCIIKEISKNDAKQFLQKNHIQGYCKASIYLGAFYNETLVSVMSLIKMCNNEWNLVRFASNNNYVVQGICSKFISFFVKNFEVTTIKTFLDRRWENNIENNVYTKSGFKLVGYLKPDYRYTNGHGKRLHKFGFRKQKLHKKYGLPLTMTETQMTEELGYYKIWDCGLIKYVYTANTEL